MAENLRERHLDFDGGETTADAVPLTQTERHEVDRVPGGGGFFGEPLINMGNSVLFAVIW